MSLSISRQVLEALLPPGSLWIPEDGAGFDQLLGGLAQSDETVREFLASLARLRSPELTPILDDLEREYGIIPDDTLTEAIRRARLLAVKTATSGNGTADFMQAQLRAAGFDVYVHVNNPPVDPRLFLFDAPATICGNATAICGTSAAYCGGTRGALVVNGRTYNHIYYTGIMSGGLLASCGNRDAICRDEASFTQFLIEYDIPADPGYWPMFFFVGGPAVRNSAGELAEIATASIPIGRQGELIRSIVKFKPVHSWGGLVVQYV
jgi:hypothetical protein